jgi:hypothetical protein
MTSVSVKRVIVTTSQPVPQTVTNAIVPVESNCNDKSCTVDNDIKKEVVATSTAVTKLIGPLFLTNSTCDTSEIYVTNLTDIYKKTIDYENFWDTLIESQDTFSCTPLTVPSALKYNLWAIYIGSDTPAEYRLVLDKKQDEYYEGKITSSPYNTFRYLLVGGIESFPKIIITDPLQFKDGTTVTFEVLKGLMDMNKAIILDICDCKSNESKSVEIFQIYAVGQPTREPIEYRIVIDKDRRLFYKENCIDEQRNQEIMDEEDEGTTDESGVKVIRM